MQPSNATRRRQLHPPPAARLAVSLQSRLAAFGQDLTLEDVSHLLSRATALENQDPLIARSHPGQAARRAALLRIVHAHPHQL